jgi:hypothetical protein
MEILQIDGHGLESGTFTAKLIKSGFEFSDFGAVAAGAFGEEDERASPV